MSETILGLPLAAGYVRLDESELAEVSGGVWATTMEPLDPIGGASVDWPGQYPLYQHR